MVCYFCSCLRTFSLYGTSCLNSWKSKKLREDVEKLFAVVSLTSLFLVLYVITPAYSEYVCRTLLRSDTFLYPCRVEVLCHDISVHIPHHISQKIPSYNLRLAHDSLIRNWGKVGGSADPAVCKLLTRLERGFLKVLFCLLFCDIDF